mmetsp:Transcript_48440/g.54905  ORF Transcript_48440/g.54905 Transcript_48440/m.54905 type:complete len:222 (+) Transcript_48440:49-714(+)
MPYYIAPGINICEVLYYTVLIIAPAWITYIRTSPYLSKRGQANPTWQKVIFHNQTIYWGILTTLGVVGSLTVPGGPSNFYGQHLIVYMCHCSIGIIGCLVFLKKHFPPRSKGSNINHFPTAAFVCAPMLCTVVYAHLLFLPKLNECIANSGLPSDNLPLLMIKTQIYGMLTSLITIIGTRWLGGLYSILKNGFDGNGYANFLFGTNYSVARKKASASKKKN